LEADPASGLGPPSAKGSGERSEAIPHRYPRLSFTVEPKAPPKGVSFPPDPQGAGKSARNDREPRGATSVIKSQVCRPRKASPVSQDFVQDDDSEVLDSEPDSSPEYEEQDYEEPVSRPSKRQRQTSSSESEHKKKKKKKRSKDTEGKIVISQDQLATLIQQCMEAKISPSSEEDSAPPSYSKIWREFRENVYLLHPDLPEPEAQRVPLRTVGGPAEFVTESLKLPMYPATASTLEACEDAIQNPISKAGTLSEPLIVSSSLKAQR